MGKITTYYKGDMLFESKLGNHVISTDVPANPVWKGQDRAPTPPEFFLLSIGSCVAAFVVQYCNNAGIDTKDMSVDVSYDKVEKPAHLTNIRVNVNLPNGDLKERKSAVQRVA